MSDEVETKIITHPICWAVYEVPANIFEIIGNQIDRPSLLVVEAMVEQGLARRVKVISSTMHAEEEEDDEEEETPEPPKGPWYTGGAG